MTLKQRLAWGYTIVFTLLFSFGFTSIYFIAERYREEEFYQRLKDRMFTTYKLLVQVEQIDHDLLQIFDRNTINSLYDEKILLFNSKGKVIYNSIDNIEIENTRAILGKLMKGDVELRLTDGKHELLALQFKNRNETFYGIAKAYDRFGRRKMIYLKNALITIAILVNCIIVLASLVLSKIILVPISRLTKDVESITLQNLSRRISEPKTDDEINILATKFNELLVKVESAFNFQYHFVHHVSHELKTPLSVMMVNAEGALAKDDPKLIKESLVFQKNNLLEVGHIVNAMLDISKAENQLLNSKLGAIRIDELLFECVDEISYLNSDINVDFIIDDIIEDADKLTVMGHGRMLKMAFVNIINNAVNYASNYNPTVEIRTRSNNITVNIYNDGELISEDDRDKLFTHFFRGVNSNGKKGFGLGLVLVQKIVTLHSGKISYSVVHGKNCFSVDLPRLQRNLVRENAGVNAN